MTHVCLYVNLYDLETVLRIAQQTATVWQTSSKSETRIVGENLDRLIHRVENARIEPKAWLEISGGCLQRAIANLPLDVTLTDYDNLAASDNPADVDNATERWRELEAALGEGLWSVF